MPLISTHPSKTARKGPSVLPQYHRCILHQYLYIQPIISSPWFPICKIGKGSKQVIEKKFSNIVH